ncbi:MAG: hypothetical protein ACK40K_00365 [Raineya sp.]
MKIPAKKIQEWCNEAISAVAWQRVVLKVLPKFREKGLELTDLMNPEGLLLTTEMYEAIANTIIELYEVEVPSEHVLV